MSRLHIHIAVDDIDTNICFYSALFGNQPAVSKEDYAKWELTEPAVNFALSKRGSNTGLDHLGIQADNDDELEAIQSRLQQAGIAGHDQRDAACCYARSDKYWTKDPQGIAWETFHTLDSIATFSCSDEETATSRCCVPEINTDGDCCAP
jgi:catechol 2,3-dioxygenase-like lactoylglutathione lyase family enzyme